MNRIKEPSTWGGIALLATGVSSLLAGHFSVDAFAQIFGGLAAVLMRERGM